MDGALKAIELMNGHAHDDLEGVLIVVATNLANTHNSPFPSA